jgi:hypothetical protein
MQTTARNVQAVLLAAACASSVPAVPVNETSSAPQAAKPAKPNILVIWGDAIGT